MKALLFKNTKLRALFKKVELQTKIKKFILINLAQSLKQRSIALRHLKFSTISKTKLKRYCVISGRSKGVSREYSISRIQFKEMIKFGIIPGYRKAVW